MRTTRVLKKDCRLKIIHVNTRSLVRHYEDLLLLVSSCKPHVIAISESWLDSSIADSEVAVPGFNFHRNDRNRQGGGVAMYVSNPIASSIVESCSLPSGLECIWISLSLKHLPSNFVIGCFYRPPQSDIRSLNDVFASIEGLLSCKRFVIACGDFNVDVSDACKPYTSTFQQFISNYSLIQPICEPTRLSSSSTSILDLFLASSNTPVVSSGVIDSYFSDHLPIFLTVSWQTPKHLTKTIHKRSFKNFDPVLFDEEVARLPWSVLNVFDDVDDKLLVFNSLLNDALSLHAPFKSFRSKKNPAPWISKSVRDEMDIRNKLLRKFRSTKCPSDWHLFTAQRNRVVTLQRQAKKQYFLTLISNNSSPAVLWKTLKSVVPSSSTAPAIPSLSEANVLSAANSLNTHFVSTSSPSDDLPISYPPPSTDPPPASLSLEPVTVQWCQEALSNLKLSRCSGSDNIPSLALRVASSSLSGPVCHILNSSLASSTFPSLWKTSLVRPLHKSGDRSCPSNYRPISILPAASKLLEKCVQGQLTTYLNTNNLLYPLQSGFRTGYSTSSALLHCTDSWYKALDNHRIIGVVFLDVSKAFDTVNHNLLLSKLQSLGLDSSAVSWFHSYLKDRSMVTCLNEIRSSPGYPSAGVPQGSVLGPSLFSTFINDFPQAIPSSTTILFADDTTIYVSGTNVQEISSVLQSCLDATHIWMTNNGLKLNSTKSKCMLIHSSRKRDFPPLNLYLLGSQVEQVSSFNFLGVIINDTLTWSDHISFISKKVARSICLLRRLSWFLPQSLLVLFLKSYILPVLDYCDVVWNSCTKKDAQHLESLLNFACRVVLHRGKHESATAARSDLGLTTLGVRRKLHVARLMHKCVHAHSPPYLASLFPLPSSHHHHFTRSSSTTNLPFVRSSFGQHAFSFSGASLWRSLPPSIRDTKSFSQFNIILFEFFNLTP
jgi:hypothetical protein